MYGVNLSVNPGFARQGVAEQLLYAGAQSAISKSLNVFFSEVDYQDITDIAGKMSVEEYIAASSPKTANP